MYYRYIILHWTMVHITSHILCTEILSTQIAFVSGRIGHIDQGQLDFRYFEGNYNNYILPVVMNYLYQRCYNY